MPAADPGSRFGREGVSGIQRARILSAMVEETVARGAGNASVAHVVARSGVSRRTFYEIFHDREDCFLAAFEEAVRRMAAAVGPCYEQPGPWRSKLRAALIALLRFLVEDAGNGRLVVVESLAAGPRALERRQLALAKVIAAVDRGREQSRAGQEPPPLTAEGVVGGVLAVIHARFACGEGESLLELVNPLMGMIVLPYLGRSEARKEIARPVLRIDSAPPSLVRDSLKELEMRLTYRTIRVLLAVGAHPGASNREVGEASGALDQGQISKLLARLVRLGLVYNEGTALTKGSSNAWKLTSRGVELRAAFDQPSAAPSAVVGHA